ncbi:MAG TPA: hypothetical protein VL137_03170 [Polyangiaceae bacterium]|jgi:hypothetical protein|nr:hypothetical protein [Polyangiaceae bacterium]
MSLPADPLKSTLQFRMERGGCHAQCFQFFWRVPPDLPYLRGHFPDFPVLPAVAVLELSVEMLRRATSNDALELSAIRAAKFMRPIGADQSIRVHLQPEQTTSEWLAQWFDDGATKPAAQQAPPQVERAETDPELLASVTFTAGL